MIFMSKLVILCCLIFSTHTMAKNMSMDLPGFIDGKVLIIKSKHPSPAFNGELQPAIALDEEYVFDNRARTKLIQVLSNDNKLYDKLLNSNGKKVQVSCNEFFRAETAHHTTKILCSTNRVIFKNF